MYTPRVLQALINVVLRDDLNRFVSIHVDDILIFPKTVLIMRFMSASMPHREEAEYESGEMPVLWKFIQLPIVLCGCSSDMSPLLKRLSRHKQILVTVLPNACLSLIVIDSRFCNCGIALICLPPCRDKVPSSPPHHLWGGEDGTEEKVSLCSIAGYLQPLSVSFFVLPKSPSDIKPTNLLFCLQIPGVCM